jgi:hypothetical protein
MESAIYERITRRKNTHDVAILAFAFCSVCLQIALNRNKATVVNSALFYVLIQYIFVHTCRLIHSGTREFI